MSTIELKHIIIEQLSHIEDISFLKAIKTIIETKVSDCDYKLSEYQKERIKSARHQLKQGKTVSHENIQREIDQWLNLK